MPLKALNEFLQHFHLCKEQPVLLGFSGGADSLCLLDLLCERGYSVVAAHLNHGLRAEAEGEVRHAERVARALGADFVSEGIDVANYADEVGKSLEEAARNIRYSFLFEQAHLHNAQAVMVGHHADDQAETVLMHFLRGSGMAGLKGMRPCSLPNPWSAEIPLLRPLLGVPRRAILAYCAQRGLDPVDDPSNQDTTLFRNRLRHEVLPNLDELVPGIRQRLSQMAGILAADEDVLTGMTVQTSRDVVVERGADFIALDAAGLAKLPLGLQRRMIRWAVGELRPDLRDLDFAAVERALTVLRADRPAADLVLGVRAFAEGERYYLAARDANLPTGFWPQLIDKETLLTLSLPGALDLPGGWVLRCEICAEVESAHALARANDDPYRAWVDLGEQPPTQLQVRARRPGDRIQPLGMSGARVKLSDLMINEKIPWRARAGWPVVCLGDQVVWLPGFRLAQPFRLTGATRRGVHLHLVFQKK